MEINFAAKWSWNDIEGYLDEKMRDKLNVIKNIITIEDANFLSYQFSQLDTLEDIKLLSKIQKEQLSLGAWVEGFLPDQFISEEHIPIPNNPNNIVFLLWKLVKQRETNLEAIKKFEAYPIFFKFEKYEQERKLSYPDTSKFRFDLSAVKETIKFIKKGTSSLQEALSIAKLSSNQEMLKHRKNLGYLPEPTTTTEDLANLIIKAQSKAPLDLIWKWLNPMNYFDFADLFTYLKEYEKVINQLESNEDAIKEEILGTIFKYIKLNIEIDEIFALTIGFGINGWVTDKMFGVNIEYNKDNFKKLIGSIGHELFHRLQTKICAKNEKPATFDELVSASYENPQDNKFYEILSYIMLEGTGEIIKYELMGNPDKNLEEKAREGANLLEQIYAEIYVNNNMENAESLLHKGLISTGPFYSLGKLIADTITTKNKSMLGKVLSEGTISFFTHFIEEKSYKNYFSKEIIEKLQNL